MLKILRVVLLALTCPAAAQDGAEFAQWVQGFKAEAQQSGISAAVFDRAFSDIRFNPRVMELDRHQPEFVKPVQDYIAAQVTPEAVQRGREKLKQYAPLLARVAKRYGVTPAYIVAIWRIETNYGTNFGGFNVVEALATLAYAGRRQAFWRGELIAALMLLQRGEVPPERLVGSWAGAMGHTQFMPSIYLGRAVDFDGDGRRDLWRSMSDVFASTANYLALSGWQKNLPFAVEVRLPGNFPFELAETAMKPASEWSRLGVRLSDGRPLPAWPGDTGIVLPSGYRGPAFLVTANYRAILAYNNAVAYALSVGLLAERLQGGGRVAAPWPADDRPLSRGEKEELQRLLTTLGFDPGPHDGQVGPQTRTAIRSFQKKTGVPADGHADPALLEQLRRS